MDKRIEYLIQRNAMMVALQSFPLATAPGHDHHVCDNCGSDAECYNPLGHLVGTRDVGS